MRRLIVYLHLGHPNDTEIGKALEVTFNELGYELTGLDIRSPGFAAAFAALRRERGDEIFLILSANHYAKFVTSSGELLHRATGIPLVALLCDHPLLYIEHFTARFDGTILFCPGEDSTDFARRYYRCDAALLTNNGSRVTTPPSPPSFEDFLSRRNAVLCPMNMTMNGLTVDTAWQRIKALPEERRSAATELIDRALTDCVTPLHVIAERLRGSLLEPDRLDDMRLAFYFIKLWRRNHVVRTLIELPIVISTDFAPADLEIRHAEKFTHLSMDETIPLYQKFRFALNAHPGMTSLLHDRVLYALAANSVCITDANSAVRAHFRDQHDMIFFEYDRDDMLQKVARYIDDPASAFEIAENNYRTRAANEPFHISGFAALIDAVAATWRENDAAAAFVKSLG